MPTFSWILVLVLLLGCKTFLFFWGFDFLFGWLLFHLLWSKCSGIVTRMLLSLLLLYILWECLSLLLFLGLLLLLKTL